MTDTATVQSEPSATPADAPPLASTRGARDAWQLPAAFLGLLLVAFGVAALVRRAPGPDFDSVLSDAEALITRQDAAAALDLLNGPIVNEIGQPGAVLPETLARYHALRGESLYLAQREAHAPMDGPASKSNNAKAIEEFEIAFHLDEHQKTARREGFIAEAMLDMGEVDEALERIGRLPDEVADRRRRLLKRVIMESLAGPPAMRRRADAVLESLKKDEGLSEADRVWVVTRRLRGALDAGDADRVIDEALPELQRLESADSPDAADLHLLLGEAYLGLGEINAARTHFGQVEAILPPGDGRRGSVDVNLAKIAQSRGEIEEARDRFASVVERYPGTDADAHALLGLGETEADLGHVAESLKAFGALVERLQESGRLVPISPEQAESSMEQRHRVREASGDDDTALEYAVLVVRAYPPGEAPASALLRLAEAHRDLAIKHLGGMNDELEAAGRLQLLDPNAVEQARIHLHQSADAYERHARAAMVAAPDEATASLWNAADAFDRAGDQEQAIRIFTEYVHDRKQDPRQLEAKYRLGRCFQALNQYQTAIGMFEEIVRANPGSDEALRSFVPLAQCYLLASNDAESEKAEGLLLQVIDGRTFGPEAPQFKRALIELGQLHLRSGRYPDAMTRLGEAVDRYPVAPEQVRLQFDLADANRLSAAQIDKQLKEAMPVSERVELERLREARLRAALDLYEQVRGRLDAISPERLTPLQRIIVRNAVLYRGDCAFDLGDYDLAIRHYDVAAQRFANDPASLVPMVQIVNCYAALDRLAEARTAHERAKARLKEIPESSWLGANVPMDRRHWERWLESSLRLDQMEANASADTSEP